MPFFYKKLANVLLKNFCIYQPFEKYSTTLMLCKPLGHCTIAVSLHSATKLINGTIWVFQKETLFWFEVYIFYYTKAINLKLQRLLLIYGTVLYLTLFIIEGGCKLGGVEKFESLIPRGPGGY